LKKSIKVSAPGKLMLFGEHAVIYGKPCIVTAVDQRMNVFIETTTSNFLEITATDVGINNYQKRLDQLTRGKNTPKNARFVEYAVKNFFSEFGLSAGVKIKTQSAFSHEFGFGSSSAVTVGVLKALSELFNKKLTKLNLFKLSYKTVLDIQGVGSGFDLAAAIWGGTVYFVAGGKEIEPLSVKNPSLVVGYSGVKADTATLVKQVKTFRNNHPKIVNGIFDLIELIVGDARKALLAKNFAEVGELANLNQGFLDGLAVSSQKLSDLIYASREAGAYGAKISGAGGGDCIIAFASAKKTQKITEAIKKKGGVVLNVQTGAQGVRIENEISS
jgi:mevalonate kinase